MSNFVPAPDGTGWYATDVNLHRVIHLSRSGRIETVVESPLLEGVRGIVVDRFTGDLVVGTSRRQLYRIQGDRTLVPLVPPNLESCLCPVHQMAQDPRTGDFYCSGYGTYHVCRVSPQGVVRPCIRLGGDWKSMVRDRRNGDLLTANVSICHLIRLSGFETASQAEIEDFPADCSPGDFVPR
jgi:hypothetical protein